MEPRVIFEDEDILVLDKPSGWIVNESETTRGQPVIQTWLFNNFDFPISKDKRVRSGIVHRLDKETSGVLLVAKTKPSFKNLQIQFKKRLVDKTYLALVHGKIELEEGSVEVPVGRLSWARKKFGVVPGGRKALTRYRVISNFKFPNSNNRFTLVEFYPKTGRTHQIRIHAKYLGHPIVSDELYAGRKTSRNDRMWCPRLFLHAKKIGFMHPGTKRRVDFESGLSDDLATPLASLEKVSQRL